jgi:hypothetical protein
MLAIACHPGTRLRDIAAPAGITERSAYAIVTDLQARENFLRPSAPCPRTWRSRRPDP